MDFKIGMQDGIIHCVDIQRTPVDSLLHVFPLLKIYHIG